MPDHLPYARRDHLEMHVSGTMNALELPTATQYARLIAVTMSWFATIEQLMPKAMRSITGTTLQHSASIVRVFRAFKNKIELLAGIIKQMDEGPEKEIASYVKGHFTEANKIRNLYAHGQYRFQTDGLHLAPYGVHENDEVITLLRLEQDVARMKRIYVELDGILNGRTLPPRLYDRLQRQFPQ